MSSAKKSAKKREKLGKTRTVCQLDISMEPSLDNSELRDKLKACLTNFFYRVDAPQFQSGAVSSKQEQHVLTDPFRFEIRFDPKLEDCFLSEAEVSYDFSNQKLERIVQERLRCMGEL